MRKAEFFLLLLLIIFSFLLNTLFSLRRDDKLLNLIGELTEFDRIQIEINRQEQEIFKGIVGVLETLDKEKLNKK